MAGTFITFEGVEGSGKSTQIGFLAERLLKLGISVVRTREPGGTKLGEGIRRLVLEPSEEEIDPLSELLLMEAARAQHVHECVGPALEAGSLVLCDRFTDSTLIYQGVVRGLDIEVVKSLNRLASGDIRPDTTILLDLDVTLGLKRKSEQTAASGRPEGEPETNELTRFDLEDQGFHILVREGFLRLAQEEPDRIKVVSATGTQEEVHERVWKALEKTLEAVVS
jgi:dTMP kinase